jgi:hypothetical protein
MAKFRVFQSISNNEHVLLLTVDIKTISSSDRDLIEKFGEPEINIGGTVYADDTTTLLLTLPDSFIKIISGLPNKIVIDTTAAPWDTDTTNKLDSYRKRLQERIVAAMTALRATGDAYTNEFITQV